MTYEQDLLAQIAAIRRSSLAPEIWIERNAAAWRAAHPIDGLEQPAPQATQRTTQRSQPERRA